MQRLAYPRQPPAALMPGDFEAETREEDLWVAQSGANIRGWVGIYLPARFIHHLYVDGGITAQ